MSAPRTKHAPGTSKEFRAWWSKYKRDLAGGAHTQRVHRVERFPVYFTSAPDYVAQFDARNHLVPAKYDWAPSPTNPMVEKGRRELAERVTIIHED